MRFTYCPQCGEKLVLRVIGDEGEIPYCERCKVPRWDLFTTSVICAVVNEQNEIALLRQDYVSTSNLVCIAGIMKAGERAEDTVAREVMEEVGVQVQNMEYISSYAYPQKDMLMLGFLVRAKKSELVLSQEVDSARWVKLTDAPALLRQGGIAYQLVTSVIDRLQA